MLNTILRLAQTLLCSLAICAAATPVVKSIAIRSGALDVPVGLRHIHTHPVPRLGGLAIFLGFVISTLLFADITPEMQGILTGCVLITAIGVIDDTIGLPYWTKLIVQLLAAGIAVWSGVLIRVVTNPNVFGAVPHLTLGWLSVPITILWIVGITNAVNLIDGLDGLAAGVSVISSATMLVVAFLIPEAGSNVPIVLAALMGACLGFLPYNLNPAKIFMGDTGSMLLGYILATVSAVGLFKFYAVVTFAVPVMALALPLADTLFAIVRRLHHHQNPLKADRGHVHHILLDIGMNQKQAVAVLYAVSSVMGGLAVLMTREGKIRLLILLAAFLLSMGLFLALLRSRRKHKKEGDGS